MRNETGYLSRKDHGVAGCSDVISPVGCLSVNTSPGMIRRLLKHNQSWHDMQVTQT